MYHIQQCRDSQAGLKISKESLDFNEKSALVGVRCGFGLLISCIVFACIPEDCVRDS